MRMKAGSHPYVGHLPSGPLDIIGDVHGEIEPLCNLLNLLGYDREDLRVIHACWSREALDRIAAASTHQIASTFAQFEATVEALIETEGHTARAQEERLRYDLTDSSITWSSVTTGDGQRK